MNTAQPDSNMIKCIANIERLISVHSVIETIVQDYKSYQPIQYYT